MKPGAHFYQGQKNVLLPETAQYFMKNFSVQEMYKNHLKYPNGSKKKISDVSKNKISRPPKKGGL